MIFLKQKKRLDVLLHEKGFADSREKARAIIMSGQVYINNQKTDKPGDSFYDDVPLEVRGPRLKYVSRGGLKLEKALSTFNIDLSGAIAMDVGASTGGFTDCMLQNGAIKVYAVDVGYGQLDWRLRNDERVVNMERRNIRYVTHEDIGEKLDFFSVDVSFISLKLVLPPSLELLKDEGTAVCLIKPQFEAGRERVGKKGVVKDPLVHIDVINVICDFCKRIGLSILALDYSPVKGPEGNIEYLIYIKKSILQENQVYDIPLIVDKAHSTLNDASK